MHKSGLHYYEPAEDFTFVTTVVDNKKHYRKRHIKEAERSAYIYGNVTYPAVVDCRLYTQSNQIKEWLVTVKYIYAAIDIWGKDIFSLKLETTRKKTI